MGKIHDHIGKDHADDLASATTIPEYFRLLRNNVVSKIFEIPGPNRLSDTQVINTFHGRMPTLGLNVADNEREK